VDASEVQELSRFADAMAGVAVEGPVTAPAINIPDGVMQQVAWACNENEVSSMSHVKFKTTPHVASMQGFMSFLLDENVTVESIKQMFPDLNQGSS
jgi:hypothetical protein